MRSTPDEYRVWIGITRDAALVAVGIFMLVYETILVRAPNPYIIGAGLTALGLPSALRLDLRKKPGED